jgi:ferritin
VNAEQLERGGSSALTTQQRRNRMISKKMADALNKQINAETYSAYLYQAMSAYASSTNMSGVANWLAVQALEEMGHAKKIYDYVLSVGAKVVLEGIDKPPTDFESVKQIFKATLDHEKKVTKMINALVDLAKKDNDHATEIFLQWFVTEQVEEEEHAGDIVAKLNMAGDKGGVLFMIDKWLGARKPGGE